MNIESTTNFPLVPNKVIQLNPTITITRWWWWRRWLAAVFSTVVEVQYWNWKTHRGMNKFMKSCWLRIWCVPDWFTLHCSSPAQLNVILYPPESSHPNIWIISNRSSGVKSVEKEICLVLNVWLLFDCVSSSVGCCDAQTKQQQQQDHQGCGSPGILFPTTPVHFHLDPIRD